MRSLVVGAALTAIAAAPASGQRADARAALAPDLRADSVALVPLVSAERSNRSGNHWWAPLASAVIPGAGQAALGQDRFVGYLAIEGYAWLRYRADLREGKRQRRIYRQLARDVARALVPGPRPVGDFDYYERMEHYLESGAYDIDPGNLVFEPETDTTTYNGAVWLLARRTFWDDPYVAPDSTTPAFRRAVAFYEERAVGPEYQWSWRNHQLEHDLFRRTIDRSNDAFRRSIQDVGIVLANHVLSTIDAYVTLRLRRSDPTSAEYTIAAELPWPRRFDPGR